MHPETIISSILHDHGLVFGLRLLPIFHPQDLPSLFVNQDPLYVESVSVKRVADGWQIDVSQKKLEDEVHFITRRFGLIEGFNILRSLSSDYDIEFSIDFHYHCSIERLRPICCIASDPDNAAVIKLFLPRHSRFSLLPHIPDSILYKFHFAEPQNPSHGAFVESYDPSPTVYSDRLIEERSKTNLFHFLADVNRRVFYKLADQIRSVTNWLEPQPNIHHIEHPFLHMLFHVSQHNDLRLLLQNKAYSCFLKDNSCASIVVGAYIRMYWSGNSRGVFRWAVQQLLFNVLNISTQDHNRFQCDVLENYPTQRPLLEEQQWLLGRSRFSLGKDTYIGRYGEDHLSNVTLLVHTQSPAVFKLLHINGITRQFVVETLKVWLNSCFLIAQFRVDYTGPEVYFRLGTASIPAHGENCLGYSTTLAPNKKVSSL